jgi:dimethylargininase
MNRFGVTSSVQDLKRVMVRTPATNGDWLTAGWREPDCNMLLRQHEGFIQVLLDLGCEVEIAPAVDGMVDAVYMYDSAFVIGQGAIVLHSPKSSRQGEGPMAEASLTSAGIPIVGRLTGDARCDGGDLMWFEDGTLIAGRTYRTNAAAHEQLAAILEADGHRLLRADMPHDKGPDVCLHLMSVVSPVDTNLAVVFEPLSPTPLIEALVERDVKWVSVDADEYERMGTNVLAVRPGVVVMLDGLPRTRRAVEAAGVETHVYDGSHLSLKGDGGPTCLTRPLWRCAS